MLMDLSKAFDTLNHDFLLQKFNAYDFQHDALKPIYNQVTNRWQRTRINATFSSWEELEKGSPRFCS